LLRMNQPWASNTYQDASQHGQRQFAIRLHRYILPSARL
jgi:hypothetical protein